MYYSAWKADGNMQRATHKYTHNTYKFYFEIKTFKNITSMQF